MHQTSTSPRARKVVMAAVTLGLWTTLVLLFAVPLALNNPASWREAVRFGASFWALWLFFLPAAAWLSFSFPIERRTLLRNVGLHVLACLVIVAINRAAFRAIREVFPRPEPSETVPRMPVSKPVGLGPPDGFGVFLGFRAVLDVLVYGSLVGVCQAMTHFRKSQERERRATELEARLVQARLQNLRMQIHPHFLFNTLNSIAALVYIHPRAADEMLGDLSILLRRSLDSMEEQEVTLGRELDFIEVYMGIERQRLGDRLQLEQSVPDELRNALVPAFLLQPLVENAIRHGIEPQRGPGCLSIGAKQEGQQLHLMIRDDGRGSANAVSQDTARHGIGLTNIQARLQMLYGKNQHFSLGWVEPRGCRVDIRLPLHREPMPLPSVSIESTL